MSVESTDGGKWSCEYCTYKNYPSSLKCTMCRGAKPLLNEDIYRLRENIATNEISNMNLLSLASGPCDVTTNNATTDGKWMCDVCTYLNSPKELRCIQCRTTKITHSSDNINSATVTNISAINLHEHIQPLRISQHSDLAQSLLSRSRNNSPPTSSSTVTLDKTRQQQQQRSLPTTIINNTVTTTVTGTTTTTTTTQNNTTGCNNIQKWTCLACTYENWPKSLKCAMCGTMGNNATNISRSQQASCLILPTSDRENNEHCRTTTNIMEDRGGLVQQTQQQQQQQQRGTSNRFQDIAGATNNLEAERAAKAFRRNADWAWLKACLGVLDGDPSPVEAYLSAGGDPARQLIAQEVALLNRSSAFDVGHTLVHLAIRFHREDMLATLLSQIEGSESGVKRVPSYVAPDLAADIRRYFASTIRQRKGSFPCYFVTDLPTFALPAEVEELPGAVQEQLFTELLDKDAQQQLETEPPAVNWSLEVTMRLGSRLYALWNRSAGDCLLDSAMQATWGVFDRDNALRRALADSLHQGGHIFYPRWKEYETSQASLLDFSLDEGQWEEDWSSLLSLASQPGASLEQLHVFALAHILRRPIIVYGVKYVKSFRGETIGYARFEGVYLPLLWEQSFCTRTPLALGYTRGHFSALVPMEPYSRLVDTRSQTQLSPSDELQITFLPLMDRDRKLLPIHFLTQSELGREETILRQWLEVCETEGGILVAQQRLHKRPLLVAQMVEEWLNHYRRLAQTTSAPFVRPIPIQDYSSDGDTDEE